MGETKLPISSAFRDTTYTHPGLSILTEPMAGALLSSHPWEVKSAPPLLKPRALLLVLLSLTAQT